MEADVKAHPIRHWRFCIAGFLQNEGRPTGISALWHKLHFSLSDPQTRVELKSWRNNWSDVAEWCWRMRNGLLPEVRIVGYSWGGFSAVMLARELNRRGIPVTQMVLCDPVYRHWYKVGQWRALCPWSKIEIPPNVAEVHWCRQTNPPFKWGRSGGWFQPAGHDLVAEVPNQTGIAIPGQTLIHEPVILNCEHSYADDQNEFHEMAMEVMTR